MNTSRFLIGFYFWVVWLLLALNALGLIGYVLDPSSRHFGSGLLNFLAVVLLSAILHPRGANLWNKYLNN